MANLSIQTDSLRYGVLMTLPRTLVAIFCVNRRRFSPGRTSGTIRVQLLAPATLQPVSLRAGLVSPEMQITNETTVATTNDALAFTIFTLHTLNPDREAKSVSIDFTEHLETSEDAAALLDEVSLKLLGIPAPESFRSETIALIEQTPPSDQAGRISEAIHAVATSLEFAVLGD